MTHEFSFLPVCIFITQAKLVKSGKKFEISLLFKSQLFPRVELRQSFEKCKCLTSAKKDQRVTCCTAGCENKERMRVCVCCKPVGLPVLFLNFVSGLVAF